MADDPEIPNLDDLLSSDQEFADTTQEDQEIINYLFIGREEMFAKLQPHILNLDNIHFQYAATIDEAIDYLLLDIYAIVMMDNQDPNMDIITNSRIVRINHPLARIIGLSNSRRSLFIAEIINHGSVDAYLPLPFVEKELMTIISEQQARHDIDKMLTNFVSSPPNLSAASYLLLDPSLTAGEEEPVKFVGLMVAFRSVPRYSKYFEDLLAKDEILFAGYLSGITMLGQELLQSKDPLKEINFGGISVIFRFHEELQFSIFVRNLSKHNVDYAEKVISEVIEGLIQKTEKDLASRGRPSDGSLDLMDSIVDRFAEANENVQPQKDMGQESEYVGAKVMLYGTDEDEQQKIQKYFATKADYTILTFAKESTAKDYLKNNDVSVLVLDSDIKNIEGQNPLPFADFVKDEYPFTQVIYQMRDRRASSPIIRSLNSGVVNYLISYRSTRRELDQWIKLAIEKSNEIREHAKLEKMGSGLNSALAAKTKFRQNQASYLSENNPILEGIFIAENEVPIFKQFWKTGDVTYDDGILAGLVASLESVSGEMFYDENIIDGIELGDSNLVLKHWEKYNFIFFIKNLGSHNANIVDQTLDEYAKNLYTVFDTEDVDPSQDKIFVQQLKTQANQIYVDFTDKFLDQSI